MKSIRTYERSMIWTAVFVGVVTLATELSSGFKGFLASITGHHWITKSVLSIILFWIFTVKFAEKKDSKRNPLEAARSILWTVVIVSLVIFGYYVWHFFS